MWPVASFVNYIHTIPKLYNNFRTLPPQKKRKKQPKNELFNHIYLGIRWHPSLFLIPDNVADEKLLQNCVAKRLMYNSHINSIFNQVLHTPYIAFMVKLHLVIASCMHSINK